MNGQSLNWDCPFLEEREMQNQNFEGGNKNGDFKYKCDY